MSILTDFTAALSGSGPFPAIAHPVPSEALLRRALSLTQAEVDELDPDEQTELFAELAGGLANEHQLVDVALKLTNDANSEEFYDAIVRLRPSLAADFAGAMQPHLSGRSRRVSEEQERSAARLAAKADPALMHFRDIVERNLGPSAFDPDPAKRPDGRAWYRMFMANPKGSTQHRFNELAKLYEKPVPIRNLTRAANEVAQALGWEPGRPFGLGDSQESIESMKDAYDLYPGLTDAQKEARDRVAKKVMELAGGPVKVRVIPVMYGLDHARVGIAQGALLKFKGKDGVTHYVDSLCVGDVVRDYKDREDFRRYNDLPALGVSMVTLEGDNFEFEDGNVKLFKGDARIEGPFEALRRKTHADVAAGLAGLIGGTLLLLHPATAPVGVSLWGMGLTAAAGGYGATMLGHRIYERNHRGVAHSDMVGDWTQLALTGAGLLQLGTLGVGAQLLGVASKEAGLAQQAAKVISSTTASAAEMNRARSALALHEARQLVFENAARLPAGVGDALFKPFVNKVLLTANLGGFGMAGYDFAANYRNLTPEQLREQVALLLIQGAGIAINIGVPALARRVASAREQQQLDAAALPAWFRNRQAPPGAAAPTGTNTTPATTPATPAPPISRASLLKHLGVVAGGVASTVATAALAKVAFSLGMHPQVAHALSFIYRGGVGWGRSAINKAIVRHVESIVLGRGDVHQHLNWLAKYLSGDSTHFSKNGAGWLGIPEAQRVEFREAVDTIRDNLQRSRYGAWRFATTPETQAAALKIANEGANGILAHSTTTGRIHEGLVNLTLGINNMNGYDAVFHPKDVEFWTNPNFYASAVFLAGNSWSSVRSFANRYALMFDAQFTPTGFNQRWASQVNALWAAAAVPWAIGNFEPNAIGWSKSLLDAGYGIGAAGLVAKDLWPAKRTLPKAADGTPTLVRPGSLWKDPLAWLGGSVSLRLALELGLMAYGKPRHEPTAGTIPELVPVRDRDDAPKTTARGDPPAFDSPAKQERASARHTVTVSDKHRQTATLWGIAATHLDTLLTAEQRESTQGNRGTQIALGMAQLMALNPQYHFNPELLDGHASRLPGDPDRLTPGWSLNVGVVESSYSDSPTT